MVCKVCRLEHPHLPGMTPCSGARDKALTSTTTIRALHTRCPCCHVGTGVPVAATSPLLPGQQRLRLSLATHHSFMSGFYEPGLLVESTRPRCCLRVSATWLPDSKQLDVSFSGAFCLASAGFCFFF